MSETKKEEVVLEKLVVIDDVAYPKGTKMEVDEQRKKDLIAVGALTVKKERAPAAPKPPKPEVTKPSDEDKSKKDSDLEKKENTVTTKGDDKK